MFGFNNNSIKIQDMACDRKAVGRLRLIESACFMAFVIPLCLTEGMDMVFTMIIAAVGLYPAGYGIHALYYRKKPVKHTLILGGPANRLYLRWGRKFIPAAILCNLAMSLPVMAAILFFSSETKTVPSLLTEICKFAPFLILHALDTSTMDYIAMRHYYSADNTCRQE